MIILAIILVILCVTKLCVIGSGEVGTDSNSLPISSIAKGAVILESLVGLFCGLFIIFAL